MMDEQTHYIAGLSNPRPRPTRQFYAARKIKYFHIIIICKINEINDTRIYHITIFVFNSPIVVANMMKINIVKYFPRNL